MIKMLRGLACLAVMGLALAVATPAVASAPAAGRVACTVTDHRIIGLSGLIVTDSGYISISDSNVDKSAIRVWFLDNRCRAVRSISYPTSAYDPEDAAIGRDGTIYVADIGDNGASRASIAVWRIRPGSSTPHIFRYRYPDHAHDAEAMLLAADDTPIFVTKDIGAGEIYVPAGPADPSGKPVALRHVGTFVSGASSTPNGLGIIGGVLITGGANSRDRTRVALRTYADAYVWEVPHGDVVKAITTTKPQVVPLPNEPQGESVAFGLDDTHLFTVSDREVSPVRTPILEYALPTASDSTLATPGHTPAAGAPAAGAPSATRALTATLRAWAIGATAVGALLIVVGVVFARRRRREVT